MGTGIVAILLFFLPFQGKWLYYLSIIMFIFNTVLYALAAVLSILRYAFYPRAWAMMMHDPVDPLYLATCPIGFATLIEMWIFICVPKWGYWATMLAWVLWMVDTAVSVVVTLMVTFLMCVYLDLLTYGLCSDSGQTVPEPHQLTGQDHSRPNCAHCSYNRCCRRWRRNIGSVVKHHAYERYHYSVVCALEPEHGNGYDRAGHLLPAAYLAQTPAKAASDELFLDPWACWIWGIWVRTVYSALGIQS